MNTMKIIPNILDKFVIMYEPMEERMAQGMTWHGLPILELVPRVSSSISIGGEQVSQRREELRGVSTKARLPRKSHEAMCSRA